MVWRIWLKKEKCKELSGTSETTGAIFLNLARKVMYMVQLKYINLIEINPIL